MDPAEVLAVEIKQFTSGSLRTLVPSVIGQTAEAQQRKNAGGPKRREGDEESFFEKLSAKFSQAEVDVARRILEWARPPKTTRVFWGAGTQSSSFIPIIRHRGVDHQLFAVYTYGAVEIYFQHYRGKAVFDSEDKRRELRDRLNQIEGISIPDDRLEKRPRIELAVLQPQRSLRQFLEIFDWFIAEVVGS